MPRWGVMPRKDALSFNLSDRIGGGFGCERRQSNEALAQVGGINFPSFYPAEPCDDAAKPVVAAVASKTLARLRRRPLFADAPVCERLQVHAECMCELA